MRFKEILKNKGNSPEKRLLYRFYAAKKVFVLMALLFFLNFFLLAANIQLNMLGELISVSYSLFVLSFVIFLYFLYRIMTDKIFPSFLKYMVIILLLLLSVFALFPLIIAGGIEKLF